MVANMIASSGKAEALRQAQLELMHENRVQFRVTVSRINGQRGCFLEIGGRRL